MTIRKYIELFKEVVKNGLEVEKTEKPQKIAKTTVHENSVQMPLTPQQQLEQQRWIENDLKLFSDYFCRSLSAIPDALNLSKNVTNQTLFVRKKGNTDYEVRLYKKEQGVPFRLTTFTTILVPNLNSALNNIRFDAEQDVENLKMVMERRLYELDNECYSPDSIRYGNNYYYQTEYEKIMQGYSLQIMQLRHLLCGLNVLSYTDCEDYIILTVRCDNRIRICLWK